MTDIKGKYVRFIETDPSKSGKTKIWDVTTMDRSGLLGQVRWWSQWRKYTFHPSPTSLFDFDCLTEIGRFCRTETESHGT